MIVYLAEYDPDNDYEPTPLFTVGIYSTRERAELAAKAAIDKNVWYYGRPEVVISEWELDKTEETPPTLSPEVVKHAALGAGVSIAYAHWLRSKGL